LLTDHLDCLRALCGVQVIGETVDLGCASFEKRHSKKQGIDNDEKSCTVPEMKKVIQIPRLLAAAVLVTAIGAVPAGTAQAAGPQVLEGAVVVLNLPEASRGYDEEPSRYYSWDYYDNSSGGYRLPSQGRAMYLAGFGAGNSAAAISGDGGCALKATDGAVWCYGRNNLDGDGTRRDRPLPIQLPGVYSEQIEYVDTRNEWSLRINQGDETLSSEARLRAICALTKASEVKCWGRNQGRAMMSPEIFLASGGQNLSSAGVVAQDGSVHVWGAVKEDEANEIELQAAGTMPAGYTYLFTSESYNSYSYQDLRLYEVVEGNIGWPPIQRTNEELQGNGLLVASSSSLARVPLMNLSPFDRTWSELPLSWGFVGNPTDSEPLYGAEAEIFAEASIAGEPLRDSFNDCVRIAEVLSCVDQNSWNWQNLPWSSGNSMANTSLWDEGRYFYFDQDAAHASGDYIPLYEIPEDSSEIVEGGEFACFIAADERVQCAPNTRYSTPDPVESPWDYSSDAFVRHDADQDGLLSLGTEMPIACGVGFQCDFTADSLSLDGGYLTAIGTLTRTARSAVSVSGIVEFEDGTGVRGGTISWASSDGLLRGSTIINASGAFTLPARTGDGMITLELRYQHYVNCPEHYDESTGEVRTISGTFIDPACVTHVSTATLPVSLTSTLTGREIILPVVQGEEREIQLRFGDGTTPMSGVSLSGTGPEQCSIATVDGLGGLYGCVRFALNPTDWWADSRPGVATDADGKAMLWMPTDADIELTASLTEADGISWSEVLDSFYDDGPNPEPYLFPGLIVAETPEPMTILRGQMATIDSAVLVDGIDPAYGLNAALEPVDSVNSTCASSDELQDTSDEVGEVTFTACPSGTGEWRVVSTDGSFFPSAPFEITVASPPMVSAIAVRGATLDESFTPLDYTYDGYFTGSTARFTATIDPSARGARVRASACRRPASGVLTCTVTISLRGVTDTYTFNLRRDP